MPSNWLAFAEDDLRAAHACLRDGVSNQACFHAQQVVEKALKAVIAEKGDIPPKTHGLRDLLTICLRHSADFAVFKEECSLLNRFYLPTRYPDAILGSLAKGLPSREDADEAIQMAEKMLAFVKDVLGEEGG